MTWKAGVTYKSIKDSPSPFFSTEAKDFPSKEEAETSSVKPDWIFKDLFQLIGAMAE